MPLACLVYQWVLVQRLEAARLMGIVAMLGLPNPILRQLSSKEAKIMEEESDESDDGDSDLEEERNDRTSGTKGKGEGKASASPKGPKAGRVKRSASHRSAGEAAKDKRDSGSAPVQPAAKEGGAVDTGKTAYAEADGGGREAGVEAPSSESASSDDGASRKKSTTISQAVHAADGATRPSVGKKKSAPRAKGIPINGKVLVPSIASVANFMVPLALWNVAVAVIYVVSWSQLHGMQGPLSSLNMASHVIYRYTRLRALAFGFVIQDDLVSRGLWRGMLAKEISLFESEYQALLYGGTPITLAGSVFNHPVPASTFESSAFALEFFRHQRCFRFDQSACFKPGDEYYEVTHHGLDVMVRRMLTEMTLLSQDDDKDVRFDGSRYNFMFYVGGQDLYEGLQQAADLFVSFSLSRYHAVTRMHLLFLFATCLLALLYVVFILWPHLARIVHDAARQSALLSHVPPEALDVRAHVRNVMRRALRGRGARARAKQHCGAEEAASTGAGAEATTGSPKEPLLLAEVAELGGS
ncbi:hypothetical protein HYH03_004168 [Edaphochlamys debaryana]|uniref:Uncharacterized protein n=1 Tax=Edaphochlamys debaryana TaxID=47281 RepID=A0A835YAV4_9CHLO|nr:hypothetical protein HYH03_004168 [Edaphochlamys debaryana]|eukprot:KAG2497903.1 hypothetical protein HYH03_004168 [Edaphochlamys debaryana]